LTGREHDPRLPRWDDKIGTVAPTDKPPSRTDHVQMGRTASTPAEPASSPRPRFASKRGDGPAIGCETPTKAIVAGRPAGPPTSPEFDVPILVAGADHDTRAEVLGLLVEIMGSQAVFEEAETFAELLVCAPSSRIVVLTGELDGMPAESLMRTLGCRHPDLPIVSLGASSPRGEPSASWQNQDS